MARSKTSLKQPLMIKSNAKSTPANRSGTASSRSGDGNSVPEVHIAPDTLNLFSIQLKKVNLQANKVKC